MVHVPCSLQKLTAKKMSIQFNKQLHLLSTKQKKLDSSMLVAVKNENNEVKCRFIPKTAKNIRTMSKGTYIALEY